MKTDLTALTAWHTRPPLPHPLLASISGLLVFPVPFLVTPSPSFPQSREVWVQAEGGGGVSSWTRGFSRARVQQDGGVSLQRDWTYAASSLPSVGNRTPAWQSRKCAQSWNPGLFWKKSFLNTYSCQMAMMAALSLTWLPRNRLRALKQIPFLNNVSLAKFTHQKSKSR